MDSTAISRTRQWIEHMWAITHGHWFWNPDWDNKGTHLQNT